MPVESLSVCSLCPLNLLTMSVLYSGLLLLLRVTDICYQLGDVSPKVQSVPYDCHHDYCCCVRSEYVNSESFRSVKHD